MLSIGGSMGGRTAVATTRNQYRYSKIATIRIEGEEVLIYLTSSPFRRPVPSAVENVLTKRCVEHGD